MAADLTPDLAILGGGIAGLWLAAAARAAGLAPLLVERVALGAGQSLASQGIIHGGLKYTLGGKPAEASTLLGPMPALWRAALAGQGGVSLKGARSLAEQQMLWTPRSLLARLAGKAAQALTDSRMVVLAPSDWPEALRGNPAVAEVYGLDEPVVETRSVLMALAGGLTGCLLAAPDLALEQREDGGVGQVRLIGQDGACLTLAPQALVLAAGAGNEALLAQLGRDAPAMQRRPLRQVMARGPLPLLYGHALGSGPKPRVTVTSHAASGGERVWYLGGGIAEQGAAMTPEATIATARAELAALFPGLEVSRLAFATHLIDRAEAKQAMGFMPDRPALARFANVVAGWPTKLAYAPQFAAQVLETLALTPGPAVVRAPEGWPAPALGRYPWEEAAWS